MDKEKDERQIAREYFKEKGLTYSDIKERDIDKLRDFIKYELQTYLPTSDHSRSMDMRLSKIRKKDYKYNKDGSIKEGCIWIAGSYFDFREGVCFNENGFIGFCGWADGSNKIPIITAFIKWCDWLNNLREVKNG
jgi:hypothetical protein